jgi:molybdate transport system substrate-binding protein
MTDYPGDRNVILSSALLAGAGIAERRIALQTIRTNDGKATMRRLRNNIVVAVVALAGIAVAHPAASADLTVISTGNIRPELEELRSPFESRSGNKITFKIQGAAATQKAVEDGAVGDAVIGPRPMLDALLAKGRVKPGSIVDIAQSSVGVAVRAGGPAPDISTDEKFKRLLLDAESIVYPDPAKGSLGGNYLAKLIVQWGIADQLKTKTQLVDGGAPTAHVVADGKAQFGINQIAEMRPVPGLQFLTPLPPILTNKIVMSAAILVSAHEPTAAAAWISFISSPEVAPVIRTHGMEPVNGL